jgi:signal transduction histidine kinase
MIDVDPRPGDAIDAPGAASTPRDRRMAMTLSVCWLVLFVAAIGLLAAPRPAGVYGSGGDLAFFLSTASFAIAAYAILRRQPGNRIGWVLMAIGIGWSASSVLQYYGDMALARGLPGGVLAIALSAPMWAPPVVLMGTVLLLRFPDGELPSARWRLVERVALISMVVIVALSLISPGDLGEAGYPNLSNPLGISALASFLDAATAIILVIPILVAASAIGLVLRFRRSSGIERLQMKWLAAAAAGVAPVYVVATIASLHADWMSPQTPTLIFATQEIAVFSFALIPIAIGVAVLRYRLYGIDVVINKALVYGSLAVFITAAYVVIVVGIGNALGTPRNVALSVIATGVVAIAFQPVKDRVQRLANRLVYGRRASPYDVLANLSSRMSGSVETGEVLPRLARLLVEGTGAARVAVWLRVSDRLRLAAEWPRDETKTSGQELPIVGDEPPAIAGATVSTEVRDRGELLGALALWEAPGDPLTPPERTLVDDVARQAALLLRNVRLIEELRASRERIVTAQDDERRRLERDIHDGAQRQLEELARSTRRAEQELGDGAPPELRNLLERAIDESTQAVAELRELAHGIHPRILSERGLPAAIGVLAERSPVEVSIHTEENGRLPEQVEATAYFAVSEALTNVAKYANASRVVVTSRRTGDELVVEVNDDGIGGVDLAKGTGLRGLLDRIDAMSGRLDIVSERGAGTSITVTLPLP